MMKATRVPDGFEEAFDGLFGRACLVARKILHDPVLAEDAAAETMARAFAHWRRIGDQPWREGWVVRVATNLALDTVRAQSRRAEHAAADRPFEDADVADRLTLVAAVRTLPRRQREVVSLRYFAGMSEADVAAALRVSTGSVKTHLHRGMKALRDRLGPDANLEEVTAGA